MSAYYHMDLESFATAPKKGHQESSDHTLPKNNFKNWNFLLRIMLIRSSCNSSLSEPWSKSNALGCRPSSGLHGQHHCCASKGWIVTMIMVMMMVMMMVLKMVTIMTIILTLFRLMRWRTPLTWWWWPNTGTSPWCCSKTFSVGSSGDIEDLMKHRNFLCDETLRVWTLDIKKSIVSCCLSPAMSWTSSWMRGRRARRCCWARRPGTPSGSSSPSSWNLKEPSENSPIPRISFEILEKFCNSIHMWYTYSMYYVDHCQYGHWSCSQGIPSTGLSGVQSLQGTIKLI